MRTLIPLLILGAVASEAVAEPRTLTDAEMDAITAGAGGEEGLSLVATWTGVPLGDLAGGPFVGIVGLPFGDASGRLLVEIVDRSFADPSGRPLVEIVGLPFADRIRAQVVESTAVHQGNGSSSQTTVRKFQSATSGITSSTVEVFSVNK